MSFERDGVQVMAFYLSMIIHFFKGRRRNFDPDCVFCHIGPAEQGAIAQTRLAYIKAAGSDNYLIVAKGHWETPDQLPVMWWFHVQWLLRQVPEVCLTRLDHTAHNWSE